MAGLKQQLGNRRSAGECLWLRNSDRSLAAAPGGLAFHMGWYLTSVQVNGFDPNHELWGAFVEKAVELERADLRWSVPPTGPGV